MYRLSSRLTFFTKWICPAIGVGFLAWVPFDVMRGLIAGRVPAGNTAFALTVTAVAATIVYLVHKKVVFDLADAVWDADSELLVKYKGQIERVALRDVKDVSLRLLQYPQRITLILRKPAFRRDQIAFIPPTFRIRSESVLIDELIQRVDAAQQR